MTNTTTLQIRCRGITPMHDTIYPGTPVYAEAVNYFHDNPDARFYMVCVTPIELHELLQWGAEGVLGFAPPDPKTSLGPHTCNVQCSEGGRMWLVFRRGWSTDERFSAPEMRDRHGWILCPNLPSDLPAGGVVRVSADGTVLWWHWETSAGMTPAGAQHEAEVARCSVTLARRYDMTREVAAPPAATAAP